MTKENLAEAIRIEKEIEQLLHHRKKVITVNNEPADYQGEKAFIGVEPSNSNSARALIPEFIPIDIKTFVDLYLAKLDKRITELQTKFDNL